MPATKTMESLIVAKQVTIFSWSNKNASCPKDARATDVMLSFLEESMLLDLENSKFSFFLSRDAVCFFDIYLENLCGSWFVGETCSYPWVLASSGSEHKSCCRKVESRYCFASLFTYMLQSDCGYVNGF